MRRLLVDTGAWYALTDRKDIDHAAAKQFFRNNNIPLVTTNFIFDETVMLLRSRLGWQVARDFGQRLKSSNVISIVSIANEDERRAWEIFLKYQDQDFSYTDCTSFAVMERLKIGVSFCFDSHFNAMKFQMVPGDS